MEKGQLDISGKPVRREGCFYAWYRGLQILCGDDGLENPFLVRPSFEKLMCKGLTFKREFASDYDRSDATFKYVVSEDGTQRLVALEHEESVDDGGDEE